ncbi:MAG TPA: trigger factor [Solibacterales bacterium]|nr:trigger factor [Bryobacterales bacterium]
MPLIEGCRHGLDVEVPVQEIDQETERVVEEIRKKVKLPGFRPGKAPASLIRQRFDSDIRQEVLEKLVPKALQRHFEDEHLNVVGSPNIKDVHFHKGEPLRFKAEFEVAPQVELGQYRGISVPYKEPEVTDADVEERLNGLRDQKAEYINIDPRPAEAGDFAVVSLESIAGVEGEPIKQDEIMLDLGGEQTLAAFKENLLGVSPGEEKEFDATYPEDYGHERLSGKTVRFHAKLKGLRRKELPELTDDFAKDLGDFADLADLRENIRKAIFREREHEAQEAAKGKLVDALVDTHDFPVPEAYVERQIELAVEQKLRQFQAAGVDVRNLQLDWEKVKSSQRDKAVRDVKATLLLDKVALTEGIDPTQDEVDREVHRAAKQERQPAAAVRMRMEKDGTLRRIASSIRTAKTLNFLFEQATKTTE